MEVNLDKRGNSNSRFCGMPSIKVVQFEGIPTQDQWKQVKQLSLMEDCAVKFFLDEYKNFNF